MFDTLKIQMDALKKMGNDDTRERVRVWVDDTDVLIAVDAYRSYRIPAYAFYLDRSKMKEMPSLCQIMNGERGEEIEMTNNMILAENGKDKLIAFKFANDKQAYIKEKFINTILTKRGKYYYHYHMQNPKSPLKVFEDDVCIAIFMPVVMKEER